MAFEDRANSDETKVGVPDVAPLPPPTDAPPGQRGAWLQAFAGALYGAIPPAPDRLEFSRHDLPDASAERLNIHLRHQGRDFTVDAALWVPPDAQGPVPLVLGLDFLGPAGILASDVFPLDPAAIVMGPAWSGATPGPLADIMRGTSRHRWPVDLLLEAGFAVLTSCYGSWVPDSAEAWRGAGLVPLLGEAAAGTGAVSLWAWALSRLVDVAEQLPEIDAGRIALVGHSRLGKAALWAGANDSRFAAVLSNESGCGGASLSCRDFGETLPLLLERFPHWLVSDRPPEGLDQHHLLACIAPRGLYVASAAADLWADPRGEYLALRAAAPAWQLALPPPDGVFRAGNGVLAPPLGWHLRHGGHELLPYDWRRFIAFLDRLF